MGLGVAGSAETTAFRREDGTAATDAYVLCVVAPRERLSDELTRNRHPGVAELMIAATLRGCDGDVVGAEARLRRAAAIASPDELPYVVDLLAPVLTSRNLFGRAAALLRAVASPRLTTAREALAAMIEAATHGDGRAARTGAPPPRTAAAVPAPATAASLLDEVERLRVLERSALAAAYRGAAADALATFGEALDCARRLGADRVAASLHASAAALHRGVAGDAEALWRHVRAQQCAAARGGDAVLARDARALVYELAAERGDDAEIAEARVLLGAEPMPARYAHRFERIVADALLRGLDDDLAGLRLSLGEVLDTPALSEGERGLLRAFDALAAAGLSRDEAARRAARRAISSTARPDAALSAHELRLRRIARALACVASRLAGDTVRGERAGEARFLRGDAESSSLLAMERAGDVGVAARTVRGYARFVLAMRRRREACPSAAPLTAAEIDVLRLVALGRKAPEIAVELGRSAHTVRTHLRNIGVKLETHTRADALARATQLGILPSP